MKIGGVSVTKCEELLVLPRGDGNDIPFRAVAVTVNDEFEKLVPMPVPPMVITKNGKQPDLTDDTYKAALASRDVKRFAFLCLKSLEPSNIEWETVDLEKPNTWSGWSQELKDAGLSDTEVNRVIGTVMIANSLDEDKIDEARKTFLLGLAE